MLKHVGGWYQKPIFILATAREYDGSLSRADIRFLQEIGCLGQTVTLSLSKGLSSGRRWA